MRVILLSPLPLYCLGLSTVGSLYRRFFPPGDNIRFPIKHVLPELDETRPGTVCAKFLHLALTLVKRYANHVVREFGGVRC